MKTKNKELDVDFIGGQSGLTKAEEKALSDFFKQKKAASTSPKAKQRQRSLKREKAFA
jgi:hypothetical protein